MAYRRAAPARSWLSVLVATAHPPSSGPSSDEAGTRTSSKNTSANSVSPVRVRSGRASIPGDRMSTTRQEMPRCLGTSGSVRTKSAHQSARWPFDVHVFCPVTTKSSPSRTARVRSDARSEPASGSLIPWHQMSSARTIRGSSSRFCCSVPYSMIAGAMLLMPMTLTGVGAPAAIVSSVNTSCSSAVAPRPP